MKLDTFIFIVMVTAALLLCCVGCEARKVTLHRTDGTVLTYERATFFGDSHSEGVSVSKQGEDLTVDVGATGSEAKLEAIGHLLGIAAQLAK